MTSNNKLSFRKSPHGYQVFSPAGTLAGTVEKITDKYGDYWVGRYNDGTQAYSHSTRTDAAWALVNS